MMLQFRPVHHESLYPISNFGSDMKRYCVGQLWCRLPLSGDQGRTATLAGLTHLRAVMLLWWPELIPAYLVNPRPNWCCRRCKQHSGPQNYTQPAHQPAHLPQLGLHCSHEFRLLDYVYLLHMYHDSPSHCSTIPVVCSLY